MPAPLIVVIDDEPLFRRSMATLLTRRGYRVEVAATATDGLALVRATRPDLLLLDRTLPDGDGLHLLSVFRREQPDLPVLMITGDPRTETRAQALRAGVVAALEKLCDAEVLLAAVAGALRPTDPRGATGHYNVGEHNEP